MAKMVQHQPYTLKLEMTEGCNLRCSFCGIQGIREARGDYKYLPLSRAKLMADRLADSGWTTKIEFTGRGEPTLNPDVVEIVAAFRNRNPKTSIMITTNGTGLYRKNTITPMVDALFNAGLNILAVDLYDEVQEKIKEQYKSYTNPNVKVCVYPEDKVSPNRRNKGQVMVLIPDLGPRGRIGTRKINNHTGAGSPLITPDMKQRCARPFREMIIRYDGLVPLCCNDWRGVYHCGDINTQTFEEVWQSEAFVAQRRLLYHKQRTEAPCKGCDNTSFRVGLLPDPTGQKSLPKPTAADHAAAERARTGGPWTTPVLRPWEKGENV